MSINADPIDQLVADGRFAQAAQAALEAGDPDRAAGLFEKIWMFGEAAQAARTAQDLPRALRNAIDARDRPLTTELTSELATQGDDGMRAALDVLAQRRRFADAAPLAEAVGERERAIDYFKNANLDLQAARMLEEDGRDREAGRLLERLLAQADDAPAMREAHLRLGLLLARRMQHDEAVRHLQAAAKHQDTAIRARRALIVELTALGLHDAARDVLSSARASDPSLPSDVDSLVRTERTAQAHSTGERDVEIVGGRYRLAQLVGAGGSGRVFRARDEVSGDQVAIKMLNTSYARGRDHFERFVREASVAGGLRHPNIVEVYDFSAEAGFTVMEFMTGGSLRERLDAAMPQQQVVRMALDVLAGLEQAHQRGVIHRDVKPSNIFFDARGTAKLGDFGVAHLLDLGQTQTGGLIGTLAYMAPEQITGARLTITADLYAVGVTLFEALSGRLPFLGPDFVAQHLGETAPKLAELNQDLAQEWTPLVAQLLAKDPSARFDSTDALRRAIQAVPLGEAGGPKPLVLPRGKRDTAKLAGDRVSVVTPAMDPEELSIDEEPRYQFETSLGSTKISTLSRAVDAILNRSVIIERFDEGLTGEDFERRLYVLARGGGPFLQRALSYDRPTRTAVYEVPAGAPASEVYADSPRTPRHAARLLKRLARAVAPLHESGQAHGSLGDQSVVIDERGNPTILVSGLGPTADSASPAADVDALLALVLRAAGGGPQDTDEPSTAAADATSAEGSRAREALIALLLEELSPMERNAMLNLPAPTTGEELYTFADAVEISLLKARLRAGRPLTH